LRALFHSFGERN